MNKEKQIEQMAKDLKDIDELPIDLIGSATILYEEEGWRKQEWVSVDDRLPEKPMPCLVYVEHYGIYVSFYNEGFYTKYVTHWMPLPEPPKMKGGAE